MRARPPLEVARAGLVLSVVGDLAELLDIDEAGQEGPAILPLAIVEKLVDEALTAAAAVHEDVFERDELVEVRPHLEVRPAGGDADVTAAKEEAVALDLLPPAGLVDHRVEGHEKPPRLRRQLVQAAAEDLVRETIGDRDVVERDLDVRQGLTPMLGGPDGPLVLM